VTLRSPRWPSYGGASPGSARRRDSRAAAPADAETRAAWLDRLFEALLADEIPFIESLADRWGELCVSPDLASHWADRTTDEAHRALAPDRTKRLGRTCVTTVCLASLYRAGRHDELLALLAHEGFWHFRSWAVMALAALGRREEAICLAESSRDPWAPDAEVDALCEQILFDAGLTDEACARHGLRPHRAGTYLATFRATLKAYPHKAPADVLQDLVATTPGDEGKWFAAAKDAGLYQEAADLASRSPCDPKTLARAARDFAVKQPEFAVSAGLLALHWLVQGYGYEITAGDVVGAYESTTAAAERIDKAAEVHERIRSIVAAEPPLGFLTRVIGRRLGL
jgi:hypothetical protein